MTDRTPGPWAYRPREYDDWGWIRNPDGTLAAIAKGDPSENFDEHRRNGTDPYAANAAAIVKWENYFDELVKVLQMQEDAELAHVNCAECDGEEVPEQCELCFPLYDDARVARRAILAKVKP